MLNGELLMEGCSSFIKIRVRTKSYSEKYLSLEEFWVNGKVKSREILKKKIGFQAKERTEAQINGEQATFKVRRRWRLSIDVDALYLIIINASDYNPNNHSPPFSVSLLSLLPKLLKLQHEFFALYMSFMLSRQWLPLHNNMFASHRKLQ